MILVMGQPWWVTSPTKPFATIIYARRGDLNLSLEPGTIRQAAVRDLHEVEPEMRGDRQGRVLGTPSWLEPELVEVWARAEGLSLTVTSVLTGRRGGTRRGAALCLTILLRG